MADLSEFIVAFCEGKASKGIFSMPISKDQPYKKCKINLTQIKNNICYQIEKFTEKQAFHENVELNNISLEIEKLFEEFKQFEYVSEGYKYSIKISKKGKILQNKHKTDEIVEIKSHNREKSYLLKEGENIPALVDLGIFTKEGKIVRSMYDKYRQINRFTEFIDDCVKDKGYKKINIVDFGCGKSYLTFIVYYYLTEVLKIETHIVGMDLKADVVAKCNKTAEKYGYENLHFIAGDIANYKPTEKVNMVISLHACDIATDLAIYHAVNMKSDIILSVPCCQHQLNSQMKNDSGIMERYGLLKERFAALATDAIRANSLEIMGYDAQVLEFIDMTHSPKNILIKATRRNKPKNTDVYMEEIKNICDQYGFEPQITKLFNFK